MIAERPEFYESFLEEPELDTELFPHQSRETAFCLKCSHKGCYSWPVTARATSYQGQGDGSYITAGLIQSLLKSVYYAQTGTQTRSNYVEGRLKETGDAN